MNARELRALLRADLLAAMKARDLEVVSALRTALAAIDNAEAVEVPAGPATVASEHVAGARAGVGTTEVARRDLTVDEVHAILETQITERIAEADRYDAFGRHDAASRLRREANALERYRAT